MAKRKINKTAAIRDALNANPSKSPSEIAEALKGKGINVSPQYVSTVKSTSKTKARVMRRARIGKKRAVKNGASPFAAALEFIRASGGLENAKKALATVEEISQAVR